MKKHIPPDMTSVNFDLRQLEIFCRVVELESFSKAADAVFLAQASVSERIAGLENMVGTRLLDRLGRKVVPTRAGELLYKHGLLLLQMKKEACTEIQEFLGIRKGEIHIGGSTIPGEYILPGIIRRFREEYPLISIDLTIADSKKIERDVLEGALELGIVGAITSDRNLACNDLWEDELVLAVPAGHRWAGKKGVSVHELADEPFILRESGSGTLKVMAGYLDLSPGRLGMALRIAARLGSSTAVKEAIKTGLGISILSLRAIDTELKAGLLKALRLKEITMKRHFYLINDRRRTASPLCRAMLEFLRSDSIQKEEEESC